MSKSSAIPADELKGQQLGKITAAEFLEMLSKKGSASLLFVWPEKKKVELLVEPERPKFDDLDVARVLDVLRGEKKKVEYEGGFSLRDEVIDRLADRVAERIASRLGR